MSESPSVHSVLFRPDGVVEITYAEPADISPNVSVIRTIVLNREVFMADILDVEENLMELVDAGLLALRNPTNTEPLRPS